jgi:hypothetical protein
MCEVIYNPESLKIVRSSVHDKNQDGLYPVISQTGIYERLAEVQVQGGSGRLEPSAEGHTRMENIPIIGGK